MIVIECLFLTITPCDAPEPWQLGSQDAASPMMQGIMDLHHDIFFFLILILVFVLRILVRALWHFHYKKNPIPQRIVHGTTIEILRTIFPSLILMFIAIPSFALLYSMDEVVVDPAITIKAIGHQWYRTYEYSDYNSSDEESLTFDSYMIPEDDLELGQSRLLEVDNRVVVPVKSHIRLLVTSADVLHSWAVPSLGVKCDAVPGRLNQISISVQREGVYYGQCSEICGTNHAFMPIVLEAVSLKDYADWVSATLFPTPACESPLSFWSPAKEGLILCNAVVVDSPPLPPVIPPFVPEPEEAPPVAFEIPAHFLWPELEHPLIPDFLREAQLYNRLQLSFFGRNSWADLSQLVSMVNKQLLIEKRIEAALVQDGFAPENLLHQIHEIRGILFYNRGTSVSETTLNRYLLEIERDGTRQSTPYRKVFFAIRTRRLFI